MADDLLLAQRVALAGARVGLRYFADLAQLKQDRKADGSIVTEADRAVEAAIRAVIAEHRPDDDILGEEQGQISQGSGERRWIIDPIDGTAMFVAGDDRWLVLVALEVAGVVQAGVAVVPAQRTIWWAGRGSGAFVAKFSGDTIGPAQPITTASPTGEFRQRRLGVVPVEQQLSDAERELVAPLRAATREEPWPTHAGLLVAGGDLDLAVQVRGKAWDYAATSLIVEEAGGCFTRFESALRPGAGSALYSCDVATRQAALAVVNPERECG
jgi:histidinol-phosphatase